MIYRLITFLVIIALFCQPFLFAKGQWDLYDPLHKIVHITAIDNKTGEEKIFLGTSTTWSLLEYAVVKDSNTNKSYLYKEGDIINNEFKVDQIYTYYLIVQDLKNTKRILLIARIPYNDIEFTEPVEVYGFEYWYRKSDKPKGDKDKDFELVGIHGYRAILEGEAREGIFEGESALFRPAETEEELKNKEPITVDEIFLAQLRTKEIRPDMWQIESKSVTTNVLEAAGRTLVDIARNVRTTGLGKNGLKLRFNTRVCVGVLDREGFSVDALSPSLRQKAGFMPGDVIKSLNGRKVSSMLGLILLFMDIKKDRVTRVEIDILRNNKPKKLTYMIF